MLLNITSLSILQAQDDAPFPGGCAMPEVIPSTFTPQPSNQINIAAVKQFNAIVWVKMNLHFFFNTDSQGNCIGMLNPTAPGGTTPYEIEYQVSDALQRAQDLINQYNLRLYENEQQWGQIPEFEYVGTPKPAQHNPIRYALSGVYLHCNGQARQTANWGPDGVTAYNTQFGVNIDKEYNAFYVYLLPVGDSNPTGAANGVPGNAFLVEDFSSANFNHEMGHCLHLYHSHGNEGDDMCYDTPRIKFKPDYNCDGDKLDNFSTDFNETTWKRCWAISSGGTMDYNSDGIIDYANVCDATPCLPDPCCLQHYQNNNIMTYSAYMKAFTEQQIARMLNNLNTSTYFEYVRQIGGNCPPPMANMNFMPNETVADDCAYCIEFDASMNECSYKFEILTTNNIPIYSTDWVGGTAKRFCIAQDFKNPSRYLYGLYPGTNYKFRLTVRSECNTEETEEKIASLPSLLGCINVPDDPQTPKSLKIDGVYPNPSVSMVTISYEITKVGNLETYLVPASTGSNQMILLNSEYADQIGIFQKTVDVSQVPTGNYYLVMSLDGVVIAKTILKI